MRTILGVVLSVSLALAGCFGTGGGQLSDAEAKQQTREAVEAFASDFSDPDGGDLRRVTGSFEAAGEEGDFSFGDFDMDILMEWGTGGTAHLRFVVQSGGTSVTLEIYCTDDQVVTVWGNDAFESRPNDDEPCLDSLGGPTGEADPFELEDLDEDLDDLEVTPHADGSVTATFTDENGTYTLEVDPQGRLVRIDIDADDATGFMEMDYGARTAISVPETTDRLPAEISGSGFFSSFDEEYQWDAFGSDTSYPLDEFEVRVMDGDDIVATFPLDGGASQSEAGFSFSFDDDGDGGFGGNDSFTISSSAWTESDQYDVIVWDLWAGSDITDNPIPGWGLGVTVVVLGGLALRRRLA